MKNDSGKYPALYSLKAKMLASFGLLLFITLVSVTDMLGTLTS